MASLSHQFAQSNKRISNYIPAQCDNTHPVEVVIHLLNEVVDQSEDEYSEIKAILNNSHSDFLNEINNGDEKATTTSSTRNLTNILNQITLNTGSGSNRRASVPNSNALGLIRPLKLVDLFGESKTAAHVIS